MLHEAVTSEEFTSKLTPEALKHWDNIVTGIVELRKMQKENPSPTGGWLWAVFMLFLWGGNSWFGNWGSDITTCENETDKA